MRARERRQVLVIVALALMVLLGLGALGIDVGYLHSARHELQRCADAGALAGASAFLAEDWSTPGARATAEARARDHASRDNVVVSPLDPAGEIAVSFPSRDRVRVDVGRRVDLFFARLFLGPGRDVSASAVAEASVAQRNVRGLKPWIIPYPWDDKNGDGLWNEGEEVHYPEKGCLPGAGLSTSFCQGTEIILKIGTPRKSPNAPTGIPSVRQEPGHFFALDFGSGAAGYRESIETDTTGIGPAVSKGDFLTLETGNMVGPTVQGVRALIAMDPNSSWSQEANVPDSASYSASDGSWMNSPRVVRIPVYDPSEPPPGGKSEIKVAGFAGFWIDRIENQGTIIGKYVPLQVVGSGGPSDGPTGPVLRTLRLVD